MTFGSGVTPFSTRSAVSADTPFCIALVRMAATQEAKSAEATDTPEPRRMTAASARQGRPLMGVTRASTMLDVMDQGEHIGGRLGGDSPGGFGTVVRPRSRGRRSRAVGRSYWIGTV